MELLTQSNPKPRKRLTPHAASKKAKVMKKYIKKAYIRTYSDNGQVTAYVEWSDGGRTEGEPENGHMLALMQRAQREGLPITRETW